VNGGIDEFPNNSPVSIPTFSNCVFRSGARAEFVMIVRSLFGSATSGNGWIYAGYLLAPLVGGTIFGAAFSRLIGSLGWPSNVISMAPISIMVGVLSYVVIFALDPMIDGNFTPSAIWHGILLALVVTGPIAFVMGPIFLIYIVRLRKGQKILSDSSVFFRNIFLRRRDIASLEPLAGPTVDSLQWLIQHSFHGPSTRSCRTGSLKSLRE
jgi:hypothetical protein